MSNEIKGGGMRVVCEARPWWVDCHSGDRTLVKVSSLVQLFHPESMGVK
jgi:hypothetical protein